MQLEIDTTNGYTIQSYSSKQFQIDNTRFTSSLLLTPNMLLENKLPQNFDDLKIEHLNLLDELDLQLVVIGTGENSKFAPPEILNYFGQRRLGIETMPTGAACRTYNVLVAEMRKVAALLFL